MADPPRIATESIAGRRPYQEDSVFAGTLDDGRLLVAVADGMGGHAAGDVASRLALETLVLALEEGAEIDAAMPRANTRVHEEARDPGKKGMGTTLVAVVVHEGEYFVANVGDSRGYYVAEDEIRQITEDHSFVAEAVRGGHKTLEEAMASPWRDALTRSIGSDAQVEVQFHGPFPVREDSALLVCSDGLYKALPDEELHRIFLETPDAETGAKALVSQALERGSDDNITVAIAEFGTVPRVEGAEPIPVMLEVQDEGGDDGGVASEAPNDADDRAGRVLAADEMSAGSAPDTSQPHALDEPPATAASGVGSADDSDLVPWLGLVATAAILVLVGAAAVFAALAL